MMPAVNTTAPIAAISQARRRILSHLEKAGATSAETAIPLETNWRVQRKALAFLRARGLVFEPQPGRYFVKQDRAYEWRRSARNRTVFFIGAALAAAGAMFAISR